MSDMQAAYALAAAAVRQRFAEQHPDYLEVLASLRRPDVAVFKGTYDSVEEVLDRLGLPYQLDPKPAKLAARIVFANCSSSARPAYAGRLEPLVRQGAWLVSSDWSLHNVVEQDFPGTVRWFRNRRTGDEVVSVEPGLESVWSDVVVLGADPQWWLESSSYLIEVLDPQKVRVEAASHELLVHYQAPAVAVRFAWEQGQVYHVISHFWLKRSRTPAERYRGPCTDFLRDGMKLSEDGMAQAIRAAKVQAANINFAMIQSAATATELVAQLCVQAKRGSEHEA
jgi:hypothetical protein